MKDFCDDVAYCEDEADEFDEYEMDSKKYGPKKNPEEKTGWAVESDVLPFWDSTDIFGNRIILCFKPEKWYKHRYNF